MGDAGHGQIDGTAAIPSAALEGGRGGGKSLWPAALRCCRLEVRKDGDGLEVISYQAEHRELGESPLVKLTMCRLTLCVAVLSAVSALALSVDAQGATPLGSNGLGGSTMTCVDRDGDGYGTGPGCSGPDADDLDATVRTGSQLVTKYGTLAGALAHLGYSPTRIWYIATSGSTPPGNDSTCVSGGAPVGIGSPCLTFSPVNGNLSPGDMVIYRGGTYGDALQRFAPSVNGTSGSPIVAMSYPGEQVVFNNAVSTGLDLVDRSWIIIDGMTITSAGSCIGGGESLYGATTNVFHDITIRHVETSGCGRGVMVQGYDNLLIEDSAFHDSYSSGLGGTHGIYVGAKGDLLSSNLTVRRTLLFNNAWNGIHVNGNQANAQIYQNVAYGNLIANYDLQNGVHNSALFSNLGFNGGSSGNLAISVYVAREGAAYCGLANGMGTNTCVCPGTFPYNHATDMGGACVHDQTNNVIENNTFYGGSLARDGSTAASSAVWVEFQASCTTANCLAADQGHNTFRNNITTIYSNGSQYAPYFYPDAGTGWPQSSTFDGILAYQTDSAHRTSVIAYGGTTYTCASAGGAGMTLTKCTVADPQFVAASPTFSSASSFNFNLTPTSPAVGGGTTTGVPVYDLWGNPFASAPAIGSIEFSGSSLVAVGPTVSITAPLAGATVSGTVAISATAAASAGLSVSSVQFQVDGLTTGAALTTGPTYTVNWDTTKATNGSHSVTAIATDSAGNSGKASMSVTVSNAANAPQISAVSANSITTSGATIAWTTNTPSDSQVSYGTTAAYGSTSTFSSTLATSHSVSLSGLAASTTYHYQVLSRDAQGNLGMSGDLTFATAAPSTTSLGGTGWQDLANTQLKSVCPANSFNGINYQFAYYCGAVVTAWSGGVADTKRNRLIIWGGGHGDYSGNEVYALNLGTGNSAATMTRLTDPSDFTQNGAGCLDTNVVDGTPVSRHTYGGLVYLPVQDKMFAFGGSPAPCGGWSARTYTLDLSQAKPTWSAMDPPNGFTPTAAYWSNQAICGYDSNTQTVICTSSNRFLRYDPSTNTYTLLSSGQYVPYAAGGAIDPKRKRYIFMGTDYGSTTPRVVSVDISAGSSFNTQDWSSQVTGCDALASASYPGLVYDPVLDRIVGYPNSGNTVYVFDSDQKTCTAQTFANGPTNSPTSTTGTFGRFQYFPGLNSYALVTLATLDAFKLTLAASSVTTAPPPANACDLNNDGVVNAADVQVAVNQSLGVAPCGTAAFRQAGQCNVVDVQRVVVAALGGACQTGQ